MKQIIQSARTGKLERVEVPAPTPDSGQVLVRTAYSVVSPGTEKLAMVSCSLLAHLLHCLPTR